MNFHLSEWKGWFNARPIALFNSIIFIFLATRSQKHSNGFGATSIFKKCIFFSKQIIICLNLIYILNKPYLILKYESLQDCFLAPLNQLRKAFADFTFSFNDMKKIIKKKLMRFIFFILEFFFSFFFIRKNKTYSWKFIQQI